MTMHDPDLLRRIELERADAARQALEEAAKALEGRAANDLYRKAWKAAAFVLRGLKP